MRYPPCPYPTLASHTNGELITSRNLRNTDQNHSITHWRWPKNCLCVLILLFTRLLLLILSVQVFTLSLCYSLMAPLITVFGFAYFILVYLINRYNLIYVNEQRWQGGGECYLYLKAHKTSLLNCTPSFRRNNVVSYIPSLYGGYLALPVGDGWYSRYVSFA